MKPLTTTAKSYRLFNHLSSRLQTALAKKMKHAFGFSASQLANRLTQRAIALALPAFMQLNATGKFQHEDDLSRSEDVLTTDVLAISAGSKGWHLQVGPRFFFKNLADYYLHTFCNLCVLVYALTISKLKPVTSPATLVFGLSADSIDASNQYSAFIDFCKKSDISVLNHATRLFIHTAETRLPSKDGYLHFYRFPIYALMMGTPLSLVAFMQGLWQQAKNVAEFHLHLIKRPEIVMLAREIATLPMVAILNKKQAIENIVLTNSLYDAQPLWSRASKGRNFQTHMIFYSQNVVPFVYKDDPAPAPLPNNLFLRADHYWVWNDAFSRYLQNDLSLPGCFHVVGPVVWYLNHQTKKQRALQHSSFKVTIFDVTPVSKAYSEKIGLIDNYYSSANCIAFIEHILEVVDRLKYEYGKNVQVSIKHKRGHRDIHDATYVQFIDRLVLDGRIVNVPHTADLFELVNASDYVVVMPYSSPSIIADSLNIPSVYYDPSNSLVDVLERSADCRLICNKEDLFQNMAGVVKPILH
ncbi:polysaccharide biosynthesis PFTS motif protein [Methylophilus sp. TWE2]|uniref:polysaccharide biosynthesis PFTS motif protein n=1 Tax=Methylophilus sp. TWE2 TaxID=1662285 RepID=UPI0009E6404E|nr:polysaccharide biosynthesis PFTS motif protein [Methylophilus sp. TWE2]